MTPDFRFAARFRFLRCPGWHLQRVGNGLVTVVFRSVDRPSGWRVEHGAKTSENTISMRPVAVMLVTFSLLAAGFARAQEVKVEVERFRLEAIEGAEAHSAIANDGPDGQPAVTAVVS